MNDIFTAVPISMAFVSKITAVSVAGAFQRVRFINEKYCVVNVGFSRRS